MKRVALSIDLGTAETRVADGRGGLRVRASLGSGGAADPRHAVIAGAVAMLPVADVLGLWDR